MSIANFWQWINNIQSKRFVLFETNLNSSTEVQVTKDKNGFVFELFYPHFKMLYDENSNLILNDNSFEIKINSHLVSSKSLEVRKCRAYILESSNLKKDGLFYHKYYSKVDADLSWFTFLKDDKNKINLMLYDSKYTISIELFYSKEYYFTIESNNKTCFSDFKNAVSAIIISVGFLSGYYYRLEEYYFQSSDNLFKDKLAFFYRSSDQKMVIYEPFTQIPSNYNTKETSIERFITKADINVLTKLTELLLLKPNIYFTLVNIFKIYKLYPLFTCSTLFVVLEILCDEINKEHAERVEKIAVRDNGFKILNNIKSIISEEEYTGLFDVIAQIDIRLFDNNATFERAFKFLNLNLLNDEVKVLKSRNKIFHGRVIPDVTTITSEDDYHKLEMTYSYYADRLYVMIAKLILKKVGFSGYIVNHAKIREKETGRELNEKYFIKI